MLNWLRNWWLRGASPVAVNAPKTIAPSGGFFSTQLSHRQLQLSGESLGAWLGRIQPNVFQRTHKDIEMVQTTVAMDGAIEAKAVTYAMDGVKDPYTMMGGAPMPAAQISWYAAQSFVGYQMCAILLQHWFIDKACTMPARDAIRNGYDVVTADDEKLKPEIAAEFKKLDKRFKAKKNCVEAVRKCRAFGIRIVLFEVTSDDPDYYLKPFNPDGVKPGSYKGMSQVDPYWITPELDFSASADPASQHFYEPTYWRINGRRYHRSHLVVLRTCEVPDVLKPTYFYGGVPLPQRLYERVYAAERTTNEGPQLALTKRLNIIEGVDIAAAMAKPEQYKERIEAMAYFRDNYGVQTLGGTESFKQTDTTLNDVDVVIMTQWQVACAIAEVPGTKMLGTMPKGFNATGEYEESSYHESLESIQEHDMEPILARHHLLCIRSYICPKHKVEPFEVSVAFAELDSETAKEHAERTGLEADRDLKWAQTGAIDGVDVRNRLAGDKDSGYAGIDPVMPPGPEPRGVVQPGAPVAAPNTQPGATPTPAPAAPAPAAGGAHDALDAAVAGVIRLLAKAA